MPNRSAHCSDAKDGLEKAEAALDKIMERNRIHRSNDKVVLKIGNVVPNLRSLVKLDLSNRRIGTDDAIQLAAIFAKNTTLTHVMLQENDIGDGGAMVIAYMLKHKNRTLKEITLDKNGVSPYGQRALRNAVYDDSSFKAMAKCNHVLQSFSSQSKIPTLTKKLAQMLRTKECAKEVLPNVLGWVTTKCDLNVVYSFKPILLNILEGRKGSRIWNSLFVAKCVGVSHNQKRDGE